MRLCDCGNPSVYPEGSGQNRYCRDCRNKRNNEQAKKSSSKIKRKARDLKRTYGITLEQYDRLFKAQEGLCAICKNPETRRAMAVDHDHETGKVRSLLCDSCNMGLGKFQDNPALLQCAIQYLARHN